MKDYFFTGDEQQNIIAPKSILKNKDSWLIENANIEMRGIRYSEQN
jgi:hypothetical protein